jgi:hypothetical protein
MYLNNAAMSLSGVGDLSRDRKYRLCKENVDEAYQDCLRSSSDPEARIRCGDTYANDIRTCNMLKRLTAPGGNAVLDNMKGQGLDLSKLTVAAPTVSTLKPAVSPAVVNPSMSIVPAYSTTGLPISNFGSNQTYGTGINPIRLGNVEIDNTPEFLKGNNKYYTIGAAAVILGGIYYATTHKKSRRRK